MICLLIGVGSFITGEVLRFRAMIICGLIGAAIGIGAFCLQGDLWIWQTLAIVVAALVALVFPGVLFNKSVKSGI